MGGGGGTRSLGALLGITDKGQRHTRQAIKHEGSHDGKVERVAGDLGDLPVRLVHVHLLKRLPDEGSESTLRTSREARLPWIANSSFAVKRTSFSGCSWPSPKKHKSFPCFTSGGTYGEGVTYGMFCSRSVTQTPLKELLCGAISRPSCKRLSSLAVKQDSKGTLCAKGK